MAKFECTACGVTVTHDLRYKGQKSLRNKKKYKSYCGSTHRTVFMKRLL